MKTFKYLSLFSGIGGFELGFKNISLNWKCIGYSEIEETSIEVYKKYFPDHAELGDIEKLKSEEIKDFDVLVGGFSCKPYSAQGDQSADDHKKGKLYLEIARLLKEKQPKSFFLENVERFTSMNRGSVFTRVVQHFKNAGYHVFYKVLDSQNFGVPQMRKRIFLVGFRKDLNISEFTFPEGQSSEKLNFHKLLEPEPKEDVYPSIKTLLSLKVRGVMRSTRNLVSFSNIHNCITGSHSKFSGESMRFMRSGRISILSPLECERLQGFPNGWTQGISTTHRYRALGNAVSPSVISEISKMIDKALRSIE